MGGPGRGWGEGLPPLPLPGGGGWLAGAGLLAGVAGLAGAYAGARWARRSVRAGAGAPPAPAALGEPVPALGPREEKALLEHLRGKAYVRLAPSPLEGVGVFALRKIPAGTNPFHIVNKHLFREEYMVTLTEADLDALKPEVAALVKSFFAPLTGLNDKELRGPRGLMYGVNATGTSTLDSSWYLNHSDEPNVRFKEAESDETFNTYVTVRDIQPGEELLCDYREIGAEFHKLVDGRSSPSPTSRGYSSRSSVRTATSAGSSSRGSSQNSYNSRSSRGSSRGSAVSRTSSAAQLSRLTSPRFTL